MSGTCSRCGRVGEMEYGSDGQPYCSACAFYGLNKQCSRCRMYLPSTELQQYKGQLTCPYCVMDLRDQDRKADEYVEHHDKPRTEVLSYVEQCERCGRDLEGRVYIWNGRKLCKSCLDDAKDTWGLERGGPMGPAQRIKVDTKRQGERLSFIESAIGEIMMLAGMKKRPVSEIVIYHPKMQKEIIAAKPMSEKAEGKKEKQENIELEGIMTKETPGKTAGDEKKEGVRVTPAAVNDAKAGAGAGKIVAVRKISVVEPKQKSAGPAAAKKSASAKKSDRKGIVPDTKVESGKGDDDSAQDGGEDDADRIIDEGFGSRGQDETQPGNLDVRKRRKKNKQ